MAVSLYVFDAPLSPVFCWFTHCSTTSSFSQNVRLPLCFKEALYSDQLLIRYLELDLDLDLLRSTLV